MYLGAIAASAQPGTSGNQHGKGDREEHHAGHPVHEPDDQCPTDRGRAPDDKLKRLHGENASAVDEKRRVPSQKSVVLRPRALVNE